MTKTHIAMLSIVAILFLVLLGVLYKDHTLPGISTHEPIRIGVVASLTGPGASDAENIRKGIQLATQEINATGGVEGRPLEMIYEDDATDPQKSVSAVQKLSTVDNVLALIGPQWDFLANAAIPVIDKQGLAAISTKAPFDTLTQDNQQSPDFFTTFPSVSSSESAIRSFFAKEHVKSVAIIAVQNDWGSAHVNAYRQTALQSGATVVNVTRLTQTDNNDFRTELAQIKQLKPDAILLGLNEGDTQDFIQWYHQLGLTARVLGNEKFTYLFSSGKVSYRDGNGMYYFDFRDPTADFVNKFKKLYGDAPQVAADTSYDAVYVLKQAIENGEVSRAGILEGLRNVKSYDGASGRIDFSANNFPESKQSVLKTVTGSGVQIIE